MYFRAVDFVRSKRDSILIEEYRARKNEQNALKDSLVNFFILKLSKSLKNFNLGKLNKI